MSSYLNNLLTTTTSRYNSLRRTLLSDEADGDTEDDTHISRVLRAYYTEKGRPFPPWLPPDPKAPQQAPAQYVSSGRQPGQPQMGRGGGGLNDLWDAPAPQQQQQEPLSLRRAQARGGGGGRFQGRPGMADSYSPEPQTQGRPLPSQRAGSYQSANSFGRPPADPSPPPSAGSGTSAQERLKAKLWGGRSTSPAQGASSAGNPSPAGVQSPYSRPSGGGGGRPPYPEDRGSGYSSGGGGSGGSGGSGGGRQQQSSYKVSASLNGPWEGDYDPYAPSTYGAGQGGGQDRRGGGGGRVGLPSGPRMR
ncbi:Sec1-binding region of Mso1-domain-containing protein [Clohesyomyces aquaticus]|uniref:Sec1-binding region of Mso1-domain-containing protein n=1 Tax=Clohesyomyces aquaticus TaxID=1231657 RepID=A0A1Y1YA00_9PLEO|nr:Sec1-binding region of Mso1-domain-containing protein [Clohesyomyces aquaticus]